jgi:tetratricopeptide (TPR) repeat protein
MRWLLCILGCIASMAQGAGVSREVDLALKSLNHPDPQVRTEAIKRIETLGAAARPQLVKAAQSHDRLLAGQAAELLMKLPFYHESDSETVRTLLADYHLQPSEQREQIILGTVLRSADAPMLLARLMNEDPDEQIAWAIGELFAGQADAFWQPLLNCDLKAARVSIRATAARAWCFRDREKAVELFKQVLVDEAQYPSASVEKLQEIYLILSADAETKGDLSAALRYRRLIETLPPAVPIDAEEEVIPTASPLTNLLAFYAGVGVVAGFGEDLATHWQEIPRPENLYGLSQVFSRPGFTPLSAALMRFADLSLPQEIDGRIEVGEIAAEHQWASASIRILEQAAKESQAPPEDRVALGRRLRCLSALYQVAKEIGDDESAIRYTEASLKHIRELRVDENERLLEARLLGHTIPLARAKRDRKALRSAADAALKLADTGALDADSGAAAVNALVELGEKDRAEMLFLMLFQQHQDVVTKSDQFPTALNNLAWLCACANMKVDIAVDAAERAIRAHPTEFGTIDTAATANYRAGNVKRAIELESFALALHPNDRFLIRQLETFKGR